MNSPIQTSILSLNLPSFSHNLSNTNQYDSQGNNPIHTLVSLPDPNYVTAFLDKLLLHKVDINGKNISGLTPLHLAILKGNIGFALLLSSKGADPWITTPRGENSYDLLRRLGYGNVML